MPCKHRVSRPLLWTTAFPRGLINPADSVLTKSLRTPIPSSSGIHTLATASGVTCRPQRRLTSSRPCRAARYDREAASSIADARRSQTLGKREIACEVVVIDVKVISRHWLGNRALRTVEWRFGCILQDLGVKRSGASPSVVRWRSLSQGGSLPNGDIEPSPAKPPSLRYPQQRTRRLAHLPIGVERCSSREVDSSSAASFQPSWAIDDRYSHSEFTRVPDGG